MTKTLKYNNMLPWLFLALIILIIPQLNNTELMDSTQSGKAFGFLWAMLGYIVMLIIITATVNHRPVSIKMRIFQFPAKETALLNTVRFATLAVVLLTIYPAGKCLTQQYKAYKTWKDASDIYNVGAYQECLEYFDSAYLQLKNNGVFLVQFGKALEMAEKNESSVIILNEAKQHLNNTILYTSLGNNYKALTKYTEAEQAYLHASNMAPAKFYPLYLMAKLYDETGQNKKTVTMANEVMEKSVKVPSQAIEEIKTEIQKLINKYANSQTRNEPEGKGL